MAEGNPITATPWLLFFIPFFLLLLHRLSTMSCRRMNKAPSWMYFSYPAPCEIDFNCLQQDNNIDSRIRALLSFAHSPFLPDG